MCKKIILAWPLIEPMFVAEAAHSLLLSSPFLGLNPPSILSMFSPTLISAFYFMPKVLTLLGGVLILLELYSGFQGSRYTDIARYFYEFLD